MSASTVPTFTQLKEFEEDLGYHFSEVLEAPLLKPHWISISLSHRCTYECQMCGVVKLLKGHELPTELVKKTLDDIAAWRQDCVVLFTGGECFLRKDAFEIFAHSAGLGLKTEAVSNGSLIDAALAERIVSSGLRNIAISLDGASEPTHDAIRQKGAFKKALAALKNLAEAKRRRGSGPKISVWTTIMKENVSELYDIIGLVKGLGAEYLGYHPVVVAQADMQNTSPDAPFWLKEGDLRELRCQLDKIEAYRKESGLVACLHDPYLWIEHFQGAVTKQQWKCNPFVFLSIGPDGKVLSCGASFGNLHEMSLDRCLATKDADGARKLMKECRKPCLQTCWARPQSDCLPGITRRFIDAVKTREDRSQLTQEALRILEGFEQKVERTMRCRR